MRMVIEKAQRSRDANRRELVLIDSTAADSVPASHGGQLGSWYCRAIDAVRGAVKSLLPDSASAQSPTVAPKQDSARASAQKPVPQRGERPVIFPPGTIKRGATTPGVRAASLRIEIENEEKRINQYEVEIHKKFAISLACLVFALLGPPIALRFPRSGVGLTIGVSISVFAVYYVGLIAGEKLADKLIVSPVIAMWAANVILAVIGVSLALTMGKRGASPRGGGFSDLFDRVLRWRRRRSAA
jgi:hypothetical protein